MTTAFGDAAKDADPRLQPAQDARFGDYQSNCAMGLAKVLGLKPREVAEKLAAAIDVADICDPPQIAGPGFINFRLRPEFLAKSLATIPAPDAAGASDRLGIEFADNPEKVVVDMSSPNLAKEMHVGHLRSTVIGDCVARILEFAGHSVERVNHIGDWGTQFGMLLAHLRRTQPDVLDHPERLALGDLEAFYVQAKRQFDADPAFADEARRTVVALQSGDPGTLALWRAFCDESLRHCHEIYEQLGVKNLVDRGESFYNDRLAKVVDDLTAMGLVEKSDGADCIFLDGFIAKDKTPLPLMVRKSDGGFNYAATDLAAARFRIEDCGATRIIYVVGAPQKLHLSMLFAALRKCGWAPQHVRLEHLAFGVMLNAAGQPFKTREGGTVKLAELLDEAVAEAGRALEAAQEARVRAVLSGGSKDEIPSILGDTEDEALAHTSRMWSRSGPWPRFSAVDREAIARTVGIAAVKYFDLSHNLTTDYRFDYNTMLSMDGNTAPYMLYAYARIQSIGRKAGVDFASKRGLAPSQSTDEAAKKLGGEVPVPFCDSANGPIILEHDAEIALAKSILRFPETVEQIVRDLRPNALTEYLFDLSKTFSRFYDRRHGVRVIDAEPAELRTSRLRLCSLTARVLKTGLNLLGIETLERM